ncbi:MAG: hypothetical protein IID45_04900 [Planctomycetes bacterium]|nr:hypothetical protein [Planctomycetota bacterium]
MSRTLSLATCCLILTFANSAVAQKPFKNKIAVAAKKSYEQAIAEAKKEYVAKLKIAIKDAGGAGKLEEAKQIEAEMKRIDGTDPLTAFRRRLIGTKWNSNPKKPLNWIRFDKNNVATHKNGQRYSWYVTYKSTVILQERRNLDIYVWHFDDKLKRVDEHLFKKTGPVSGGRRLR